MLKKIGLAIEHGIERTCSHSTTVGGFVIITMAVLVSYGALRRYAFNSPEPYSYEIALIGSLIAATLCITPVQWIRRNIKIDFLLGYFPERLNFIVQDVLTPMLALVYVVILAWWGIQSGLYSLRVGEISQSVLQPKLWPLKFIVTIGWWGLTIVLVTQLIHAFVTFKERMRGKGKERDSSVEPPVIAPGSVPR